jgi:hypothetical protein
MANLKLPVKFCGGRHRGTLVGRCE